MYHIDRFHMLKESIDEGQLNDILNELRDEGIQVDIRDTYDNMVDGLRGLQYKAPFIDSIHHRQVIIKDKFKFSTIAKMGEVFSRLQHTYGDVPVFMNGSGDSGDISFRFKVGQVPAPIGAYGNKFADLIEKIFKDNWEWYQNINLPFNAYTPGGVFLMVLPSDKILKKYGMTGTMLTIEVEGYHITFLPGNIEDIVNDYPGSITRHGYAYQIHVRGCHNDGIQSTVNLIYNSVNSEMQ